MFRKMFLTAFAAAIFAPMIDVPEKAQAQGAQYSDLTETQPFYRIAKGFEDTSMAEIDNNPDTKLELAKGKGLTNLDYVFPKNVKVKEIRFQSDTPQYQRVVLMRGSSIYWISDFYKFEDGVIVLPSEIQADTIRIQTNGPEGTFHSIGDIEVIGQGTATNTRNLPKILPELIQPERMAELVQGANKPSEAVEAPVPTETEMPIAEEEDIEAVVPAPIEEETAIPEQEETPEREEEVIVPEEAVEPTVDVLVIEETPVIEEKIKDEDTPIIEKTPIEEAPAVEEPVIVEPTEEAIIQEDEVDAEPIIEEPAKEEEEEVLPEVIEPVIEEDQPTVPEKEEVITDKVELPRTDLIHGTENPLNSSIFSVSKTYAIYKTNAASFKLMNNKKYDEDYLLEKLSHSLIRVDGELLNIKEFIALLHTKN